MTPPSICVSAICVILYFCALVKSEETVEETIKSQNRFHGDIINMLEGVDIMQKDVEVLTKKAHNQIKLLKEMHFEVASPPNNHNGVCTQLAGFFNSTYRKYNQFEERIVTKLEDIQEEQTASLNRILDKQKQSKNCRQGSALDIMTEALAEIEGKVNELAKQLTSLEALEEKIKQRRSSGQTVNDDQMKMLKEINEKLSLHQEKFENLEKELPKLVVAANGAIGAMKADKERERSLVAALGLVKNKKP